jgi:tetratricopeptide (TPR) repeat protein
VIRTYITAGVVVAACLPMLCQPAQDASVEQTLAAFNQAISEGRLVGGGSAFDLLQKMKPLVAAEDWGDQRDRLLDELTRRASQVVTRYTTGDEVPQQKPDYDRCAELYEAASQLDPSDRSKARMLFCRGRSYLEPGAQRDFDKALDLLKRAIDASPDDGGYHYNALGVAYLQQGLTTQAAEQFRKAIAHDSPTWTYPRHHLALTDIEIGDYPAAQQKYRQAIENAGEQQTGYLHYNLGLLAHQLGQRKEAQREYETALNLFKSQMEQEKSPERAVVFKNDAAQAYNALGALWAAEGKRKQAEEAYDESLKLNPELEAARGNLQLLHGKRKKL